LIIFFAQVDIFRAMVAHPVFAKGLQSRQRQSFICSAMNNYSEGQDKIYLTMH